MCPIDDPLIHFSRVVAGLISFALPFVVVAGVLGVLGMFAYALHERFEWYILKPLWFRRSFYLVVLAVVVFAALRGYGGACHLRLA